MPFADLVLAVVRRTRAGRMFYHPDKKHLHHRLLEIGHSQRRAVLIMWLWAGLIAFGAVLASLFASTLDLGRDRGLGGRHLGRDVRRSRGSTGRVEAPV